MEPNHKEDQTSNVMDELTNAIGGLGKWQVMLLSVIVWPTSISTTWQQQGIIFIAPNTTFTCIATNLTDNIVTSQCYNDCIKYEYHTQFENTIISQWDLICDRAWMANFTQTVAMFGVLLGSILFGFIADRYGRRPALLTASMLQLCTSIAEGFCPSYWMFTTVRLLIGMSTAGILLSVFIFIIETTGPKDRVLVGYLSNIPIAVGEMIMPILAYFLRRYNLFCLGVAIPNFINLLYFFIMPESPKWLISMNRLEEASKVMQQAAKWNNLPHDPEHMMGIVKRIAVQEVDLSNTEQEKSTYWDLFKNKILRMHTVCSCTIWFMIGVTYYGSNQHVGQNSSKPFISVSLAGALQISGNLYGIVGGVAARESKDDLQIPGVTVAALLSNYVGRRPTLIGAFSVCALCNALVAIPNNWYYFNLVMGTIGVSCAAGAFSLIYLYTTELFPTVVRNMAMGASSTVSRVGSMLAPFAAGLVATAHWLPSIVFTIAPLIAIVACYCLPETKGKKLTDHLV